MRRRRAGIQGFRRRLLQLDITPRRVPVDAQLPANPPKRPALSSKYLYRVDLRHLEVIRHPGLQQPTMGQKKTYRESTTPQYGRFSPARPWPVLPARRHLSGAAGCGSVLML